MIHGVGTSSLKLTGGAWVFFTWYFLTQKHILTAIVELYSHSTSVVDGTQAGTVSPLVASTYAFMNGILPLEEAAALLIGYVTLKLLCGGIRIIKSWIPTIS